jgi:hypothetical protein
MIFISYCLEDVLHDSQGGVVRFVSFVLLYPDVLRDLRTPLRTTCHSAKCGMVSGA